MVQGYGGAPGRPPGQDPFGANTFGDKFAAGPPAGPAGAAHGSPPPATPRREVNTLATLSVVFAFVFAPAGAILGHLALTQIGRTGQAGRDRALVGITLSYVAIVVAVVMLVVGVTIGRDASPATVAKSPSQSAVATPPAPPTTPAPLPPAPPPPPPPMVDAAGLSGVFVPVEQIRDITGDAGVHPLESSDHPYDPVTDDNVLVPNDCAGAFWAGIAQAYQAIPYKQYADVGQGNEATLLKVSQVATVFDDVGAAQRAERTMLDLFHRCAGAKFTWSIPKENKRGYYTIGSPQDAGAGVTMIRTTYDKDGTPYLHAFATKANVLVEVLVSGGHGLTSEDVEIVRGMLSRIPG